ncbi:MAG: gas vesicle protein GvpN [Candidatus Altiarchaeales archaeon]|nr:gas vesicle protein GvpN [Candidatus Altiarchaeota archaeon]MBU4341243.1 gas vesicle protein GvpN [Candidatus Altiarchaeota archaeon]MCG2782494.1 gas vesicle protein GvpN [Candidatus Altiarchaeales archaeon]
MVYKSTHGRTVRGSAIHDTGDVKKKRSKHVLDKTRDTKWHKDKEAKEIEELKKEKMEGLGGLERERIEAAYLIPEIENFVETDNVKNIEERVKLWLGAGYPVHIIGPTGCGKTTVAMKVAQDLSRPVVWINGDDQVTTTDLIGGYSQIESETLRDRYIHNVFKGKDILKADWVDNPLTLACKYGYTLVYNEFSRTKPVANNILLSVLEEKILELPTKYGEERYIKVHPDFNLILTSNSIEYAGVHRAQDALLDRTVGIYMDLYDSDTEIKIVEAHTRIATPEAEEIVRVIGNIRRKVPDAEKPGTRACIMVANGIMASNGYAEKNIDQLYLDILATKVKGPEDLNQKQKLVSEALSKPTAKST